MITIVRMCLFALLLVGLTGCSEPKKEIDASSAADYFNKTNDVGLILPEGRFKEGSAKDVGADKIQVEDFGGRKYETTATKEGKDYKFGTFVRVKK